METLHEDISTFMIASRLILLRLRNVSYKVLDKIERHILRLITPFQKKVCFMR